MMVGGGLAKVHATKAVPPPAGSYFSCLSFTLVVVPSAETE